MGTKKEIVVKPPETPVEGLLELAVKQNVPVETLERLLAMRTQIATQDAKRAFDEALTAFQHKCPTIKKSKSVHTRAGTKAYSYAPIESIIEQVKELLAENFLSYTFKVEMKENSVKATCVAKHVSGHTESSEMEVPLGNKTDVMSNSQVVAAATTFAKRYAFCNAFGIMTGDEDNDAQDSDTKKKKTTPATGKALIFSLLKKLDADVTPTNAKEEIHRLTGIEFAEDHEILEEITSRLQVLLEERNTQA